jgi:predicted nuclease of predicted toxin-antitoxin system
VKFKIDENLPVSSPGFLASAGHDVETFTEEGLPGASDRDVVAAATEAGRILVSLDLARPISAATRRAAAPELLQSSSANSCAYATPDFAARSDSSCWWATGKALQSAQRAAISSRRAP